MPSEIKIEDPRFQKSSRPQTKRTPTMSYTIQDAVTSVQEEVFKRIQNENQGDFTQEEFDEIFYDILHEECDDEVNIMDIYMAEDIIMEYGLQKSIQLMIFNNGPLQNAPSLRNLAYLIIKEKIVECTNFASYTQYCNENPL